MTTISGLSQVAVDCVITFRWSSGDLRTSGVWHLATFASNVATTDIVYITQLLKAHYPNANWVQDINIFIGNQEEFFRSVGLPISVDDPTVISHSVRKRNRRFAELSVTDAGTAHTESVPRDTERKPLPCRECKYFRYEEASYKHTADLRIGYCLIPMPPRVNNLADAREVHTNKAKIGCVLGEKGVYKP